MCPLFSLLKYAGKKMTDSNSKKTKVDDDEDEVVLPGFRFHPTDEELVGFYLRRKVEKKHTSIELIKEIDIYKYNPWDLPKGNSMGSEELYSFCIRARKYRNSMRPNRTAGSGFWKATGIDKPINGENRHGCIIGLKKTLVYYIRTAGKSTKTDWMLHEFRLPPSKNTKTNTVQEAEVWTLCRIFKRRVPYSKNESDKKLEKVPTRPIAADSSFRTCSCLMSKNGNIKCSDNGHESNQMPFSGQLSLATHQLPSMGVETSFWNQNSDECFGDEGWDELRPIVNQLCS